MNAARRPLVAANWKLHGSLRFAGDWARDFLRRAPPAEVEVLVCPAFVHIAHLARALEGSGVAVGAQNISEHRDGAFTGEVSAAMLKELGCDYVLVGHSERRLIYRESDEQIAGKLRAAAAAGLKPVLCVGETLDQRRADETREVLRRQLDAAAPVLSGLAADAFVIAYEPVWAIGTGETAAPEQAQQAHAFIRDRLGGLAGGRAEGVRVVYGGSVKTDNAASLFQMNDVDGGLVGGASLKAEAFADICRAAPPPEHD
ncbi:MAG: triose-phosphate isomerase [Gammaproteobacteria bacterium]|nr:triose-phosphate isomerase [Gammaproteobacteria bacterium]